MNFFYLKLQLIFFFSSEKVKKKKDLLEKNMFIREYLGIVLLEDKMRKDHLRWHKHRRHLDTIVKRSKMINVSSMRIDIRWLKKILVKTINKKLSILNLFTYLNN